jgi:hypothetical protein
MTVLPELLVYVVDMMKNNVTGTMNLTNPGLISHNEIFEMYKEIVDPAFTWTNFSQEQQRLILDADRSNNYLDTSRLENLYPMVTPIKEAVKKCLIGYKKCLDKNILPTFRGLKLNKDDKIRQHATQQIRSYFKIDYKNFEENFKINAKDYFRKEIEFMSEMKKDGLVNFLDSSIELTELGRDFVQNIMNVFDSYDPPNKSYNERLEIVKKAKLAQAKVQESL